MRLVRALASLGGIGPGWAGNEDDIGKAGRIVDAGGRRAGIHHDDVSMDRLGRDKGVLGLPPPALESQLFVLTPEPLHDGGEFLGHGVALIVRDRRQAEHAEFALLVTGDNVQAPAAAAHVIDDGTIFGEVQRMPAIEDVYRGDQQHIPGDRRQPGRGDERVDGVLAEFDFAAVTALAHPLRQGEDEIEAKFVGLDGAFGIVVKVPRGLARRLRGAPGALLVRQKKPQHQGLPAGPLEGRRVSRAQAGFLFLLRHRVPDTVCRAAATISSYARQSYDASSVYIRRASFNGVRHGTRQKIARQGGDRIGRRLRHRR